MIANADQILRVIDAGFYKNVRATPADRLGGLITNKTGKTTSDIKALFSDALPIFREWKDELAVNAIKDFEQDIAWKEYEVTVKLLRRTVKNAKSVASLDLAADMRNLANSWVSIADREINTLLVANGNAFDGTAFFANDRPNMKGTDAIDNLYTGTGVTLTTLYADAEGAITQMQGFKDKYDEPYNETTKFLIYCPTQLWFKLNTLATKEKVTIGGVQTDNALVGMIEVLPNARQSKSDNDWYISNPNAGLTPFISWDAGRPTGHATDDVHVSNKDMWFTFTGDKAVSYGLPTSMIKINN